MPDTQDIKAIFSDFYVCIGFLSNWGGLQYIPEEYRTFKVCQYAMAQDRRNISQVPWASEELTAKQKEKLCCGIAAADDDGFWLRNMPIEYVNMDRCKRAVKQGGYWAYKNIPWDKLRLTPKEKMELQKLVIKYHFPDNEIPDPLSDERFRDIALKWDGLLLVTFEERARTRERCERAVKQNGKAMQWVPSKYRDESMYLLMGGKMSWLEQVPDEQRTKPVCKFAITQNGGSISEVPLDVWHGLTKEEKIEWCKLAMKSGFAASALREIDNSRIIWREFTQEDWTALYNFAVEQDGRALEMVPYQNRTKDLCVKAMLNNAFAAKYVDWTLFSQDERKDWYRLIVAQAGERFYAITDDTFKTQDLCIMAAKQLGDLLFFKQIPKDILKNSEFIQAIRDHFLSEGKAALNKQNKQSNFFFESKESRTSSWEPPKENQDIEFKF